MEPFEAGTFAERIGELRRRLERRRIGAAMVCGRANVMAFTGVDCDNACWALWREGGGWREAFITDFRYVPMVHRTAPHLDAVQLERGESFAAAVKRLAGGKAERLGYEGSVSAERYLGMAKTFGGAKLVDIGEDLLGLRAVKTPEELWRLAAAERLTGEIWAMAKKTIRRGMTELEIQRTIRHLMIALGDGEAFETIVCAGANAAECHHAPDDTVWKRGMPLLVDMGVKFQGVCSDMTRCIPAKGDGEYMKVYGTVLKANRAAIAAARPGMTAGELDGVARKIIADAGYGEAFGHSLGHGVGFEIHEAPNARPGAETVLEPGMVVTIEPGIYLEGRLGVRIEDLVLITTTGCETLSSSPK